MENADYITPTGRTERQGSVFGPSGAQRIDHNAQ